MNLIEIKELLSANSGTFLAIIAIAMTLIEITPIKMNPWSAIAKWFGKVFNGEVLNKLDKMEQAQAETRQKLDDHIRIDDERNADLHRARILEFNTGLIRGLRHTEEDFNEILYNIKFYETYCGDHPEYQNNRAVHAIKNIERVYDECMKNHDFL